MRLELMLVSSFFWAAAIAISAYTLSYGIRLYRDEKMEGVLIAIGLVIVASVLVLIYSTTQFLVSLFSRAKARVIHLAWTNPSRSGANSNSVRRMTFPFAHLRRRYHDTMRTAPKRHEVEYTFLFWRRNRHDITETWTRFESLGNIAGDFDDSMRGVVIPEGREDALTISLFWGQHCGYAPRASRAITSCRWNETRFSAMTSVLGRKESFAEGVTLGILARNKGVHASDLRCGLHQENESSRRATRLLEQISSLATRPAKTHQGFVGKAMEDRYGSLGVDFVACATDLFLCLMDASIQWTSIWLSNKMEHQDAKLAWDVYKLTQLDPVFLRALYDSSYAAMLSSIHIGNAHYKPSFVCAAILLQDNDQLDGFYQQASPAFKMLAKRQMNDFATSMKSLGEELRAFQIISCVLFGRDGREVYRVLPDWRHQYIRYQDPNLFRQPIAG